MTKLLSEGEVAGYRERGYHFPVDALSANEVTEFRRKLEDYEAATGGPIQVGESGASSMGSNLFGVAAVLFGAMAMM